MILKEYEAKEALGKYGIAAPRNLPVRNMDELSAAFASFGGTVVLKPLGMKKRGKLGYVHFVDNIDDARKRALELFAVDGVKELLIEEKLEVSKEFYLGIAIDYSAQRPVLVLSSEGGVDIEETGKNNPGKVKKMHLSVLKGINPEGLRAFISSFGLDHKDSEELARISTQLYKMFLDYDADLIEVNPLALTKEGKMVALDCLFTVSDEALFRHPEFAERAMERNYSTDLERQAGSMGWSYLDMDGDIGILSSGAGLTMTILDLIKQYGGNAANFLDTAQMGREDIYKAFDLVSSNKKAKVIFVNIFAGLNRCDHLAEGIKNYIQEKNLEVPIVVRMIGNKEEEGFEILKGIDIEPIKELEPAVQRAVAVASEM